MGQCNDPRRHDNVSHTLWPVLFKTILAIAVPLTYILDDRKVAEKDQCGVRMSRILIRTRDMAAIALFISDIGRNIMLLLNGLNTIDVGRRRVD